MKLSLFSIDSLKEIITGDSGLTPKQKGPELVELFGRFGIRDVYDWGNGGLPDRMSRNQYAVKRLEVYYST